MACPRVAHTTCAGLFAGVIPAGLGGVRKLAFLIGNIFAMTSKKNRDKAEFLVLGQGLLAPYFVSSASFDQGLLLF